MEENVKNNEMPAVIQQNCEGVIQAVGSTSKSECSEKSTPENKVKLARPIYPKLPTTMVKGILDIIKHGDIDALKLEIEQ